MRLLVLDCETTGFDPKVHKVCELAGAVVANSPNKKRDENTWRVIEQFTQLIDPGMPIPPDAMAVHHILNRNVVGKPSLEMVMVDEVEDIMPFVPVAHNVEFDSQFIPVKGDWICTYRCAKHEWPDCPSYSNQTLRYYLELFKEPEARAMPPHRAAADVWVTAHVLIRLLRTRSVAELLDMTKRPILLKKVHFGKHFGMLWAEVPRDYLKWILKAGDFDMDVVFTARHYV